MNYISYLNDGESVFRGAVFCEENGGYIFRD